MTAPFASHRRRVLGRALATLLMLAACHVGAKTPPPARPQENAEKALVLDGSAVLTAGNLHVNITNWGLIGSRYSFPSSYFDAPSGQWPGGSGEEYLFGAGIWVGGRQFGSISVTSGYPDSELRPPMTPDGVIHEARDGVITAPDPRAAATGVAGDLAGGDDDQDGRVDEDPLDGRDNDGDGRIDEDFAQRANQMLACTMRDDDPISRQMYPDHRPLGLEIRQEACAWHEPGFEDLVGLRWIIKNDGPQPIRDLYVGLLVDGDIGRHADPGAGSDDLAGAVTSLVRQPEGYWEDHAYGWMRDGDAEDALPGWLGIYADGSGLGDPQAVRPANFPPHAIRFLDADFTQGYLGIPELDGERYDLLARGGRDRDVDPAYTSDYAVLMSVGPYEVLHPGEYVILDAALVVAPGAEELQGAMRQARELSRGRWYDADDNPGTGRSGRESLVCAEDFGYLWNDPFNPIYRRFADFWDESCLPNGLLVWPIRQNQLRWVPALQKHCVYVNMDNCDECRRLTGEECTTLNGLAETVNCYRIDGATLGACTGMYGREVRLPWTNYVALPPPPWLRLVPRDRAVEIYWDDRSERTPDPFSGKEDFESYRIWRADEWDRPVGTSEATGPPVDAWALRAEYDLVNFWPPDAGEEDHFPSSFGRNTGLEDVAYRPACLDDPRFDGLQQAMDTVVLGDVAGVWRDRPDVRDRDGVPVPGLEPLLPWEGYPAVLDTFFAVTARPEAVGEPKAATRYYRYLDEGVHNGYVYFYSVTATDRIDGPGGAIVRPGSGGLPTGSFAAVVPREEAASREEVRDGTYQAYVYPNPATRESLARFQQMHPNADDPTGVRVAFANLPACRSRITIYTLAGDLVQTLEHDGSQGAGQTSWNLTTRNGQEVVSGIYLYVIEPLESGWEDSTGKFVVVR